MKRVAATTLVVVAGCVLVVFLGRNVLKAKQRARRANCMANLRQLGIGISLYYQEHANRMPPLTSVPALASSIAPQIGHAVKLFGCPSDLSLRWPLALSNLTQCSYAFVTNVTWQQPVTAPLLFDKLQPTGLTVLTGKNKWSPQSAHEGEGGCVLFTDGHVEWRRVLDVGTNRYPIAND